ncbi:MAG: amidohydrolase family protein [Clostridia bacterium]|nr:amidohydrolase family protein [Clostridia bacterium]
MSIIDTNVFYGRWPFRNAGFDDMDRIRAVCDKNGVDGMLVASVQSIFYEDPFEAELELHRQLAGRRDAWQVYTVNPLAAGWRADLDAAVDAFGIKAVKIYPGYHPYSLQGPEIAKVCEAAGEHSLPLIVAGCVEDVRVTHMLRQAPLPADRLGVFLGTWRDVDIVLSNLSFGEIMALKPNLLSRDRVYVDMAGLKFISFAVEKLLKVYPVEMLMFGSQCPLYVQRGILNEVIMEGLPGAVQQAILYDNACRVFNLKHDC